MRTPTPPAKEAWARKARGPYLVVLEPELVAPVEPLVPELLEVPADPLVDGVVLVEVPDEPMPEVAPDFDESVELLDDGVLLVELPPVAPMPDVEPEVDEPLLMLPVLDEGRVDEVEDEDEGVVEPVAEPPAAPMPDAEPLLEPVELQAAKAAEQARARINLFIRESPCGMTRRGMAPRRGTPRLQCNRHGKTSHRPTIRVGRGRAAMSDGTGSASA